MSDVQELADLWAQYVTRRREGASSDVVRALYLVQAGGDAEMVFLYADGTVLQAPHPYESLAQESGMRGDAARCLVLLRAALSGESGWGFLAPEAISSIRGTLADSGLVPDDFGLWEIYAARDTADVVQNEKKGA